ncbi:energy transducer TonB [Cytophagaceae bacterium DM2B3-1]|uniref:Energy transducer TonB n=1 Tax=Xanthocytophaga flava TaxID=3048013 RepID=A0ABT7CVS5_9BACT|nr:energy transducer TonB [Xanthocytophaga flavus]MDJ1466376.1 energy transducer TonB [Xanthocytophaga flavus]MDJ1497883.1 energy transducer TonB [Xanthocytophaga flavus]
MEKANTIALSLNDIIFENRNKSYGAYQLRSIYERYLQRATFLGVVAFSIVLAILWNMFKQSNEDFIDPKLTAPVTLTTIVEPPPIEVPIEIPPPPSTQQQVATVDLREMKVTSPEDATPNENITHIEDIGEKEISNENHEGPISTDLMLVDPNENTNTGVGELIDNPDNKIFTAVEQMPEFPGGREEMNKFLSKNLRFPASAQQKGVSGVVYISFVVSNTGAVSDIKVLKGIDEACDKEAVRVVEKMPNWKPGRQNGRNVTVRYSLPLRFAITQ